MAGAPTPQLVGRDHEVAAVGALAGRVKTGDGGALLVRGEVGSGKSSLLAVAASAGVPTVLSCSGTDDGAEVGFAALARLLAPVAETVAGLPAGQRSALESALAAGPTPPPDRLRLGTAVLELLARAAAAAPVLVLVDDLQWIDAATVSVLDFVARRTAGAALGVLLAQRAEDDEASRIPDLPELVLTGLDAAAAAELLAVCGLALDARQIADLVERTGGNPLALIEVAPLVAAGRLGAETHLPAADQVSMVFAERVRALPAACRRALALLAAGFDGEAAVVLAALRRRGEGPEVFEPAVAARVVVAGPAGYRFRHPLLRSAAYQTASARERSAAHRELAAAYPAGSANWFDEQRVWHCSAACEGPDAVLAAELACVGAAARGRHAWSAACRAFLRAAGFAEAPLVRAGYLVEAAECARREGRFGEAAGILDEAEAVVRDSAAGSAKDDEKADDASAASAWSKPAAELEPEPRRELAAEPKPEPRCEQAAELEPEPRCEPAAELEPEPEPKREQAARVLSARILAERVQTDLLRSSPLDLFRSARAMSRSIGADDPASAAALATAAATAGALSLLLRPALEIAAEALEHATAAADPAALAGAHATAGYLALTLGDPEAGRRHVTKAAAYLRRYPAGTGRLEAVVFAAHGFTLLDEHAAADLLLEPALNAARDSGQVTDLAMLSVTAAETALRAGRWDVANARAAEGATLAWELHHAIPASSGFTTAAWVAAARGDDATARDLAARARACGEEIDGDPVRARLTHVEALRLLVAGRFRAAADALVAVSRWLAEHEVHNANTVLVHGDLIEALLAADDRPAAQRHFETLAAAVEPSGSATIRLVHARAAALLTDTEDAYTTAAEAITESCNPFEAARTRLAHGSWLRKHRRHTAARVLLDRAATEFRRLRAAPWLHFAEAELARAGAGARFPHPPEISAVEAQIALRVAEGRTNRQIAEELFLAVKTIEYHLAVLFERFGIRRRTELARIAAEWAQGGVRRGEQPVL